MPSWKKVITSGSNAALNSLNVTTAFTASGLNYPTTDGTSGQVVTTDGAGNLSFSNVENTTITIKNVSGGTIQKGTPCYITGSGTSGNVAGVFPADAGNALRMPAGVIAGETLIAGAEGIGLINGFISGVNTSTFAAGDTVYVAAGGGYTNVRPTGSSILVQKLGNVEKSHVSNGSGVINGPGYYNDVPNIQQGYTWVGNSSGVAVAVATSSIQNVVSSSYASTSSWATNVVNNGVTSVATAGTVSGITLTGGTITSTGTITLGGSISGLTNSNLSGTAGITNANLANSSITVGSTSISLGSSATTIAGLSSVTSTTFVGALTGTASYASNALTASYATYAASAGSATSATNATNIGVTDASSDTTTWVLLAGSQTGTQGALSDAGLTFNASTNALTATTFIGALTGTASYASQALSASYATTAGSVAGGITGTGVNQRVALWSGTSTQTSNANLTFDGTTLAVGGNATTTGYTIIGTHAYLASGNYIYFDSGVTNDYAIRKTSTSLAFSSAGNFTFNKDVDITGTLTATVKSFIIDHPTKPEKKLQYGVLEGPEHSVYVRGKLKDTNKIILPDYWHALVDEDTITVNLTAIGKKQELWVEEVNSSEIIIIGSENEINCFYTVFAERKDIGKLITEFDK